VKVVRGTVPPIPESAAIRLWDRVSAAIVDDNPVFCVEAARAGIGDGIVRLDTDDDRWGAAGPELLEAALFELLAGIGHTAVHASVVALGESAALITGDSGTGKSTLAYLAGLAGGEVVSDDVVLLRDHNGGWEALGTSRELRLLPRPELEETAGGPTDPDGKRRVPPRLGRLNARIDRIVVLTGPREETTVSTQMPAGEVLECLLGQAALALRPGVVDRQLRDISLVAQLPAQRVRPGRELLDDPRLAVRWLFEGS
jgi:hypothetical protein